MVFRFDAYQIHHIFEPLFLHQSTIFESFEPEMQAALEKGSLEEVNKIFKDMKVADAEEMVNTLSEVGFCGPK